MNQRKTIKLARKRSRGVPSTTNIMRWWKAQPDNPDSLESVKQRLAYISGDQDTTDYNKTAFDSANEGNLTNKIAIANAKKDYYDKQLSPVNNNSRTRRRFKQPYQQASHEADKTSRLLENRYEAHPLYTRGNTFNYGDDIYNDNLGTNAQATYGQQLFKNTYDLKHGKGATYKKGADFFFDYDDEGSPTRMNVNGAEDILNRREKMRGNTDIDDMFDGRIDDYGTQEFVDEDDDNGFVDPDTSKDDAKKYVKKYDSKWAKKHGVK